MAPRPDVQYNPVPSVESQGGGGSPLNIRATPDSFGGGIAQATEKLGATGEQAANEGFDVATHFARMTTEAKANDSIANQWAPQAAQLRAQYDDLRGQDKIKGYDGYIKNLQTARDQLLGGTTSPYEKQILGNYISRHITQEIDGAKRELVTATHQFEDQAHADKIMADSQNAIANYNNPEVVKSNLDMIDGQIEKHGLDRGWSEDQIDEQQRNAKGALATGMINRAVASKDIGTAHAIYDENKPLIPGDQRLQIETTLHAEGIQQHSNNSVDSLAAGQPLPPMGGPAVQQAKVATVNAAQTAGVSPTHALTVARIESNFGQNVGSRGDLGQTGKPAANMEEQAQNMVTELKRAGNIADTALGRASQPWEQYVAYQQGAGGAPALFKAAKDDPTARAVDVLAPLYKTRNEALQAVTNNGGNATMTAGQFLDFIHQHYDANASRAAVATQVSNLSEAITAPTEKKGIAVQPAASPVQSLSNFDKVYPDMLARANAIPNIDERQGVLHALEERHRTYQMAASAWKTQFTHQIQELAIDPTFTSMNDPRITPEIRTAFADDYQAMTMLRSAAKANSEEGMGAVGRTQGTGYVKLFHDIHNGAISDPSQLDQYMDGKTLTPAGLKELRTEFSPENQTQEAKLTYDMVHNKISPKNINTNERTQFGEQKYLGALNAMKKQLSVNRANQVPDSESFNADSKDWIGKVGISFQPTKAQLMAATRAQSGMAAGDDVATVRPIITQLENGKLTGSAGLEAIQNALKNKKMSLDTAKSLAIKYGYARAAEAKPSVPMAQ